VRAGAARAFEVLFSGFGGQGHNSQCDFDGGDGLKLFERNNRRRMTWAGYNYSGSQQAPKMIKNADENIAVPQ